MSKPWKLFAVTMAFIAGVVVYLLIWAIMGVNEWHDHCEQLGGVPVRNGVCIDKSVVLDQR